MSRKLLSKENYQENINTQLDSLTVDEVTIEKGTELYYARIIPRVGMCYVQPLVVRSIYADMIVGVDKTTKNAQIIGSDAIGKTAFTIRKYADKIVKEAQNAGLIRTFKNEETIDEENR